MLNLLRNWFRKPKKPSGWTAEEASAFDAMLGGFEETIVALKATTRMPEPGDKAQIWRPRPYIDASAASPDCKIDVWMGDVELEQRYVGQHDGTAICETRQIWRDRAGKIQRTTEWKDLGTRIKVS